MGLTKEEIEAHENFELETRQKEEYFHIFLKQSEETLPDEEKQLKESIKKLKIGDKNLADSLIEEDKENYDQAKLAYIEMLKIQHGKSKKNFKSHNEEVSEVYKRFKAKKEKKRKAKNSSRTTKKNVKNTNSN